MEINTGGGDADVARRIALEVRLFLRHSGKESVLCGEGKSLFRRGDDFCRLPEAVPIFDAGCRAPRT